MDSLLSHDEKTCREHLKNALSYKGKGNAAYKAGDLTTAIRKYHNALMSLKAVGLAAETEVFFSASSKLPKEMKEERDQLKSECYNNLAACLLAKKETDYERVVQYCKNVLDINPGNVKAAYRMGSALIHLGQLEKARNVLTSQPSFQSNRTVQTLIQTIQEKEKVQEENFKVTCKKMFSNPAPKKSSAKDGREFVKPILIKPKAGESESSFIIHGTEDDGSGLIRVASVEKEAAC